MSLLEYMLMPDGTVKAFQETVTTNQMKALINEQGGVEYYWRNYNLTGEYWCCTYPGPDLGSEAFVDLPEMVKLAVMLE